MRADKTALGTLPAAALQYCEPVRVASAHGWYVFPPADIRLRYDGVTVYIASGDEWVRLESIALGEPFLETWTAGAPKEFSELWPPFLTQSFVPAFVQIWSGYLVKSLPGWGISVGPLANVAQPREYATFEGIIQSDSFAPCPLFGNIKLLVTDRDIVIPRTRPLFHVRPLPHESYVDSAMQAEHRDVFGDQPMSADEWRGYRGTIRRVDGGVEDRKVGSYSARARRESRDTES